MSGIPGVDGIDSFWLFFFLISALIEVSSTGSRVRSTLGTSFIILNTFIVLWESVEYNESGRVQALE